jgi:hypothetical protein
MLAVGRRLWRMEEQRHEDMRAMVIRWLFIVEGLCFCARQSLLFPFSPRCLLKPWQQS